MSRYVIQALMQMSLNYHRRDTQGGEREVEISTSSLAGFKDEALEAMTRVIRSLTYGRCRLAGLRVLQLALEKLLTASLRTHCQISNATVMRVDGFDDDGVFTAFESMMFGRF